MPGSIFGPRLYRIFQWSQSELKRKVGGRDYELNTWEWIGETFINTVSYAITFTCYCSPLITYYIYQKGLISNHGQLFYCLKIIIAITAGMISSYLMRGYGRSLNPEYNKFLQVLNEATQDSKTKENLQLYDFDFRAWPVDFRWDESIIKSNVTYDDLTDKQSLFDVLSWPSRILQYLLAHGLARPMMFPGSVKLLQLAMAPAINDGRMNLIEKNGSRAKVLTEDGNEIDTMFLDRRGDENRGIGNTLVICCEGNAAYYEVGCVGTPLKAGYSVLGWNHPGFFGSSGLPYAKTERAAIDAVVRYAVTRLGFPVEEIIMFAWSIGGYTASYAAMMYPNMKGLILDATFDKITPLAVNKMPEFAGGLVEAVVKNYMDLDNVRHCLKYPGPTLLIRRQRDELISVFPGEPSTNRANTLLINILVHRYPSIFVKESVELVWSFLSARNAVRQSTIIDNIGGIDNVACESRLSVDGDKPVFPLDIGAEWSLEVKLETALFLSLRYMEHFDATHCMPLPSMYCKLPWQHSKL